MRPTLISTLMVLALAAASPAGAQTQAALDAAWREAMAATPTPVGLARDRAEAGTITAEEAPDFIAQLRKDAAWDRSVGAVRTDVARLTQGCATPGLDGCVARQGGWLAAPSGEVLYWQIQKGSTDEGGTMEAVVLFQLDVDGGLRPVGWTRGGFYQPPVLIQDGEGAPLHVAVAGVFPGTGAHNADLLYRWTPGSERPLTEIDAVSWRDDLAVRLPIGLEVWKGIDMNYAELNGWSPLWQATDANCCATGGSIWLGFSIGEDQLVLETVSVRDPLLDLSLAVPVEVFDYARRRAACAHFDGEAAYDAERRAQIETALTDLRCDVLETDGAALKVRHADAPAVLAALARIEARHAI